MNFFFFKIFNKLFFISPSQVDEKVLDSFCISFMAINRCFMTIKSLKNFNGFLPFSALTAGAVEYSYCTSADR